MVRHHRFRFVESAQRKPQHVNHVSFRHSGVAFLTEQEEEMLAEMEEDERVKYQERLQKEKEEREKRELAKRLLEEEEARKAMEFARQQAILKAQ